MRSEDRMKFVYVVTTGTDDPTKASLPLHLAANGSVEVGHDTSVLLAGDATEMLFGDNLEQMQGIGVPPVRDLIAKLGDPARRGRALRRCRQAADVLTSRPPGASGVLDSRPGASPTCLAAVDGTARRALASP